MFRIVLKLMVCAVLSMPMAVINAASSSGEGIMVPTEEPRKLGDAMPPSESGASNDRSQLQKAAQSQQQSENSGQKHYGAQRGVNNRAGEE